MLRRAVIQALKDVPALGGRVYQAFLAPANTGKPYATVKVPAARGDPQLARAGTQPLEVRLYADPDTFASLDQLESAVIDAVNGKEISDVVSGSVFHVEWEPGGGDFQDDQRQLIGRLVMFEAAVLHEPTGS